MSKRTHEQEAKWQKQIAEASAYNDRLFGEAVGSTLALELGGPSVRVPIREGHDSKVRGRTALAANDVRLALMRDDQPTSVLPPQIAEQLARVGHQDIVIVH